MKHAAVYAKERWILCIAREAEVAKKDRTQCWHSIRKLQMGYAGHTPSCQRALKEANGELTRSPEEVKAMWYQRFSRVLTIRGDYSHAVVEEFPALPVDPALDESPSLDELLLALRRMKRGKAGGQTGILHELLIAGGEQLITRMLKEMEGVWREGEVVEDWKHAEVVPIPNRGDLQLCDNWRGISLLDVVGKVFARILQERLQVVAEKILPESECGFRKGRGCVDMIYTVRQLVKKSREHDSALFMLFVDLHKAYDSVPRSALWKLLAKCGIPPTMLYDQQTAHLTSPLSPMA